MAPGTLCALLLPLALQWGPGWAGEFCHGWVGSPQRGHRGFQCPELYDGPQATFCCGTCSLRYCCSARGARLDQGQCPGDHQQPSPRPPVPALQMAEELQAKARRDETEPELRGSRFPLPSAEARSSVGAFPAPLTGSPGVPSRSPRPEPSHLGKKMQSEQSEVEDSASAGRDVMGEWIDLENEEARVKQDKSVSKTHAVKRREECTTWGNQTSAKSSSGAVIGTERTELSGRELDALQSFCTVKIRKMHQQLILEQGNGGQPRKLQHGSMAEKPQPSDLNCTVPDQLMNRLHLKNIRETLKQVAEGQIHDSSVCPDCQEKRAELAKISFLRRKKFLLESVLTQQKLEEQMYSRDVLTRLGEALRSFPKPSEDPRSLWQRLKGQKMYSLKVGNTTQGHQGLGEFPVGSCVLNPGAVHMTLAASDEWGGGLIFLQREPDIPSTAPGL
ncbi:uncharacterized protein C8orf48 homolog [Phaethornis superciliosus]